jgi:hypothetical protein
MHARALLSGEFITPVEPLRSTSWQITSAVRRHGRYRYLFVLQLAPGLDDRMTHALLRALRDNMALAGLQQGQHYQWGGVSVIGFRAKASAALFRLFIIPPSIDA